MKNEMTRREFLKEGGKAGLTVAAGLVFGDLVAETSLSAEAAEFSDFTENNLDETNGIVTSKLIKHLLMILLQVNLLLIEIHI